MKQHQQVLDEIALDLRVRGYRNKIFSRAEYLKNYDVVGLAFDHWGKEDNLADKQDYGDDAANAWANKAWGAYLIISDLAKELSTLPALPKPTPNKRIVAIGDNTGVTRTETQAARNWMSRNCPQNYAGMLRYNPLEGIPQYDEADFDAEWMIFRIIRRDEGMDAAYEWLFSPHRKEMIDETENN